MSKYKEKTFHDTAQSDSAANNGQYQRRFASIDKGKRGLAGQKCPHTSSKPLRIHKVFSADFSLSGGISAPAKLLRIGQPWIFEGFLFFWRQAGWRPPTTKGQKAPKRLAVRRVCPCESTLLMKDGKKGISKDPAARRSELLHCCHSDKRRFSHGTDLWLCAGIDPRAE